MDARHHNAPYYIAQAIEGTENRSRTHIEHAIGSLCHRKFEGQELVFDLRGNVHALKHADVLRGVVESTTSSSFQRRVRILT